MARNEKNKISPYENPQYKKKIDFYTNHKYTYYRKIL